MSIFIFCTAGIRDTPPWTLGHGTSFAHLLCYPGPPRVGVADTLRLLFRGLVSRVSFWWKLPQPRVPTWMLLDVSQRHCGLRGQSRGTEEAELDPSEPPLVRSFILSTPQEAGGPVIPDALPGPFFLTISPPATPRLGPWCWPRHQPSEPLRRGQPTFPGQGQMVKGLGLLIHLRTSLFSHESPAPPDPCIQPVWATARLSSKSM